jgi:hypothetical protein
MMRMSDGQPSGVIKTMDEGWLVTTSDDVADEQQTIISGHRDDGWRMIGDNQGALTPKVIGCWQRQWSVPQEEPQVKMES